MGTSHTENVFPQLKYPERVQSSDQKVIYSLLTKGEQSYIDLKISLGLSKTEVISSISRLLKKGVVKKRCLLKNQNHQMSSINILDDLFSLAK